MSVDGRCGFTQQAQAGDEAPRVRRRKQFHSNIQRFGEDGKATQAFYDEQRSYPVASEETERISGVSSAVTPSPMGKLTISAMLPKTFQTPEQIDTFSKMTQVVQAPLSSRVFCERDSRGNAFYRVRYDLPSKDGKRRQKSISLGNDPDAAAWAKDITVEKRFRERRYAPRSLPDNRIQSLRSMRGQIWELVREIAANTGFYFHGLNIRRRRTKRHKTKGGRA